MIRPDVSTSGLFFVYANSITFFCLVRIKHVYLSKLKIMKVKDLIEQLVKLNPDLEVLGMCTDPTDYTYKVPIKSITLNDPFDSNGYSGVDGSEVNWVECYDEDEETGEEFYIGPRVVLLDLGNV